ncbi:hypothetical protein P3H15_48865 [Rhodococcus sp. T2V]|nr:hypothetical protein [Rhodococcus sp. T2V]
MGEHGDAGAADLSVMTDPLHVDLTERLGRAVARAAREGDPLFGTVEVTIEELTELLERQVPPRDQDAAP